MQDKAEVKRQHEVNDDDEQSQKLWGFEKQHRPEGMSSVHREEVHTEYHCRDSPVS